MRSRVPSQWLIASARTACAIVCVAACVFGAAVPALAVSERDLVALAQAGLSDDVLVALVEADETMFPLDAPRILELRDQGLSERVILAMLKNGRSAPRTAEPRSPSAALAPPPELLNEPPDLAIPGEQPAPPPAIVEPTSAVLVPWVPIVTAPIVGRHSNTHTLPPSFRGFGRFINDGWVEGRPPSGAR